ncbi:MORC family CW-type zinc finger protein 3-like, partial [Clarias magur]
TYLEKKQTFSGELEFDVMKDRYDIRISYDDVYNSTREMLKTQAKGDIPVPESEYSLRPQIKKTLLVTFIPALDLQQVNYDCEVIDEILTQK